MDWLSSLLGPGPEPPHPEAPDPAGVTSPSEELLNYLRLRRMEEPLRQRAKEMLPPGLPNDPAYMELYDGMLNDSFNRASAQSWQAAADAERDQMEHPIPPEQFWWGQQ